MPKMNPQIFGAAPNSSCHGIDPEAFLETATGQPFAAHQAGIPPIEKKIERGEQGVWHYALYRDGWAAELNTKYGGECRAYIGNCTRYALYDLAARARKANAHIRVAPAMEIPLGVVKAGPKDLQEVGCNPAHNAYTGIASVPDNFDPLKTPFRTTGVHLHTSLGLKQIPNYNDGKRWWEDPERVRLFVKMADVYVGLPYTYLLGSELAGVRRRYYGKAGEFRFRDYGAGRGTMGCGHFTMDSYPGGIEYRVPGGEVLVDHALINMGFGVLRRLYLYFNDFAAVYEPKIGEQIRKVINAGTTSPDLLDLVQQCPGMYNQKVLKYMRENFYGKLKDKDFLLTEPARHFGWKDECHRGWSERVKGAGCPNSDSVSYNV